MLGKLKHIQRAKDNESIADSFYTTDCAEIDWAITLLFYAALQYVDAYLFPRKPKDHDARDSLIQNTGTIADIYPHYRRLKDMSQEARYEVACYAERDLEKAKQRLEKIKAHMLPLFPQ